MSHFALEWTDRFHQVVGRVADFCPICRSVQPFVVRNAMERDGAFIVAIPIRERPKQLGRDRVCEVCAVELPIDGDLAARVSRDASATLATLIAATNPGVETVHSSRLDIERRVREGRIDAELRRQLLLEPFELLEDRVEAIAELKRFRLIKQLLMAGLGVGVARIVLIDMLAIQVPEVVQTSTLAIPGISIVIGVMFRIRSILRSLDLRALLRMEIYPILARGLAPLKPTDSELRACLTTLRDRRMTVGKIVDVGRIHWEAAVISKQPQG